MLWLKPSNTGELFERAQSTNWATDSVAMTFIISVSDVGGSKFKLEFSLGLTLTRGSGVVLAVVVLAYGETIEMGFFIGDVVAFS